MCSGGIVSQQSLLEMGLHMPVCSEGMYNEEKTALEYKGARTVSGWNEKIPEAGGADSD